VAEELAVWKSKQAKVFAFGSSPRKHPVIATQLSHLGKIVNPALTC
jgi:hypothetical protein